MDPMRISQRVYRCMPLFAARGIEQFTLHDLRRTVRTGLARLGVLPHVAERVLSHRQPELPGVAAPEAIGVIRKAGPDEQCLTELETAILPEDELYAACRTNGKRATKRQMAALHEALVRIVEEIRPCTVRQTFYQATVKGIIEKTEAGYDRVQRALVGLRRSGRIDYHSITDNTRWQIKPTTFNSLADALEETARVYRRAVWSDVDVYCEVWLEKDALAGVVVPITTKYDVPLMVARGFSSLSFLHSAAEDINALEKPAYIYHLGDHDPSGVCAGQKIEQTLCELALRQEGDGVSLWAYAGRR